MKVLVGIPCLLTGGTEIQTLSLVQALVAAGHEVTVACYFEHAAPMVARYEAAGARVVLMSASGQRPAGLRRTAMALWSGLRRVVKQVRPAVAHVQYMAPGALPILMLRALGVKRIVATAHTSGDIYGPRGLQLIHWLSRRVLAAFQCITLRAEKSFFGDAVMYTPQLPLRRHGNHFTIYNTLPDYMEIAPDGCVPAPGRPVTIGVVSRLERIKGMDLVVPAFAQLHERYPSTRLMVVGDGNLRYEMEAQVSDAGLTDCVTMVGRKPQDDLQQCYDSIDILLMPSRSEGFGLTAIEGMARGCVVVAADTGGLPEVVIPEAGLLHRPESVDDIVAKVSGLLASPERRAQLSRGAVERARAFSFDRYSGLIADLYCRLC